MRTFFGIFVLVAGNICLWLMFQAALTANILMFVVAAILAVVIFVILMLRRIALLERGYSDMRRRFRRVLDQLHKVYGGGFATNEAVFFLQALPFWGKKRYALPLWGKKRYALERQLKQPSVNSTSAQKVIIDYFTDSPLSDHVEYEARELTVLYIFREGLLRTVITLAPPVPAYSRRVTENELEELIRQLEDVLSGPKD